MPTPRPAHPLPDDERPGGPTDLTPEQARAQLAAADAARPWARGDLRLHAAYLAFLGLLVAATLAAIWWSISAGDSVLFAAVMIAYGALLLAMILVVRRARVIPRGFRRANGIAVGLTMSLYAIGVAWFTSRRGDPVPAAVFLPFCALVAVPALAAAAWMVRESDRR